MAHRTHWPADLPPRKEVLAMFAEAKREAAFWQERYERLRHVYPDLWVTVQDGEVIDTDTDQETLLQRLRAAGLERPHVWTAFVPKEPMSLLL